MLMCLSNIGFALVPAVNAQASVTNLMLPGASVQLDSTVYVPATVPAPAVLLAHGWAGNKTNMAGQARELQAAGYLVLAWTARGFGNSTGYIELNSPQAEVADVSRLIDYLAGRGDVTMDGSGDPRVGISGGSYGGAVSIMAAGLDPRVDAVAANITWNDLQQSLFPQFAVGVENSGVLKKSQAAGLFAAAQSAVPGSDCGRIEPTWCAEYKSSMNTGVPSAALSRLLHASSPAAYAADVTAPTLLMQGQADSLFDLSESLRTAQQICSANSDNKVAMLWHLSGHSATANAATSAENSRTGAATKRWFDIHLRGVPADFATFQVTRANGTAVFPDGSLVPTLYSTESLPITAKTLDYALPRTVSTLSTSGVTSVSWTGVALTTSTWLLGSPLLRIRVASTSGDAMLFFSTLIKRATGASVKPQGLVAPIRLSNIPAGGTDVLVQLPAVSVVAAPGDSLAVSATVIEPGYDSAATARTYTVTPLSALAVPSLQFQPEVTQLSAVRFPAARRTRPPAGCAALAALR